MSTPRSKDRGNDHLAALGFVPVALHFDLFSLLASLDKPSTGEDVFKLCRESSNANLQLIQDTLLAMTGIEFVDFVDENLFSPNDLTKHLAANPSAQHGALHFTTEVLLASSFLMTKLLDTNFAYPFPECDTPMQLAYRKMGKGELAELDTYSIMQREGRMDSFNTFMAGKFFKTNNMPIRLAEMGYDLGAVLREEQPTSIAMVDIGGGRGEMLLQVKEAFPDLATESLVVQEYNAAITTIPGITLSTWNIKDNKNPQPIRGAKIYSLSHIFHNLPDLDSAQLLKRIADAMASYSRLLIHDFSKNANNARMHAAMIELYGGRERSSKEWHQLAELAGLKITFETYPAFGDGLIEMRKDVQ